MKEETGGVNVVCEQGIITTGNGRNVYYIPSDRYRVNKDNSVLPKKLQEIRNDIVANKFDQSAHGRVTLQQAHSMMIGETDVNHKCSCCKKKCTARCGCMRRGMPCNSGCGCSGNCDNFHNHL